MTDVTTPAVAQYGEDAEAAIASVSARVSNWDRWGPDDARGTVNFIDPEKRSRHPLWCAAVRRSHSPSRSTTTDRRTAGSGASTPCTP